MPYVPVQRDEGRILYQSTMDRAKLLGDTLTGLGETLYKRDEENKAFSAKSSAMKQLMLANKESFFKGLDENSIKQFINGDINKTAKENYLNLATFMEGKITAANIDKDQANTKHLTAQADLLSQQIKQHEGMVQYMKDDEARNKLNDQINAFPAKNQNNAASNAAQFLPGASVFGVSPSVIPQTEPKVPPQTQPHPFKLAAKGSESVLPVSPVTPPKAALETFMPPEAVQSMSRLPAVNPASAVARSAGSMDPVELETARQRFDGAIFSPSQQFALPQIKLSPEAKDIARRLREQYDDSGTALASAPAAVAAAAPSLDPLALELARQKFDTGISSQPQQFTLPQIKLSPGAKAIAKSLREQYDDSSAVLERRAATPRLTAGEDEGKAGSLKKKKTITLDEEGIKAILSNPRILVESFGDVMGDPYERAMRNQATDAAFKRNAEMRELERQFGVRTPARRGK